MPSHLELLAGSLINNNTWPFVALDWYVHRAAEAGGYDRRLHLVDCVDQLRRHDAPWPWSLQALLAVAAELMNGDARAVEEVCATLLEGRSAEEREADRDLIDQLAAAGLSRAAQARLGVTERRRDASVSVSPSDEQAAHPADLKVFVSYSHEDEELDSDWNRSVLTFAGLLHQSWIDVQFDQYDEYQLGRDWDLWGPQAIDTADVIVGIASPGYASGWKKATGSGVSDEARAIRAAMRNGKRLLFVVLPGRSKAGIPADLQSQHYETVQSLDAAGIRGVLGCLMGKPQRVRPDRGTRPTD
jgi:hypothetical protein